MVNGGIRTHTQNNLTELQSEHYSDNHYMMEDIKPPDKSEPAVQKTNKTAARIRDGLLFFLEAIGLRRSANVDSAAQVASLKRYHTEFRKLISANNSFLETTADLEHKILSRGYIDPSFTKRKVMRAIADIYAMVESLNAISRDRYSDLKKPLERTADSAETFCSKNRTRRLPPRSFSRCRPSQKSRRSGRRQDGKPG